MTVRAETAPRELAPLVSRSPSGWEPMNTVKVTLLLASLTILLVLLGGQLGGTGGMVIALGFAIVMNIGSYWFSDKLALT